MQIVNMNIHNKINACLCLLFALVTTVNQTGSHEIARKPWSFHIYVPGADDEERWNFVNQHIRELSMAKKSDVLTLLHKGLVSKQEDHEIWRYQLSVVRHHEQFSLDSYELRISFDKKDEVSSVGIYRIRSGLAPALSSFNKHLKLVAASSNRTKIALRQKNW
jgi:hypothetical protein